MNFFGRYRSVQSVPSVCAMRTSSIAAFVLQQYLGLAGATRAGAGGTHASASSCFFASVASFLIALTMS